MNTYQIIFVDGETCIQRADGYGYNQATNDMDEYTFWMFWVDDYHGTGCRVLIARYAVADVDDILNKVITVQT